VLERILSGRDARVRRQRDDGVCVREVETDAFGREPIERRRRSGPAVGTQRVCAERVDRDQQNVLTGDGPKIGLRAPRFE
jgi:hypothetical protein